MNENFFACKRPVGRVISLLLPTLFLAAIICTSGCASNAGRSTLVVPAAVKDTSACVISVGGSMLRAQQIEGMRQIYFSWPCAADVFPAQRGDVATAVFTEATYSSVKDSVNIDSLKNSPEWKLLSTFYPGQLYLKYDLAPRLGIPDSILRARYMQDRDVKYRSVKRVGETAFDTSLQSYDEVRNAIALATVPSYYIPDSAYFAGFVRADPEKKNYIDSATALKRWPETVQKTIPQLMLRLRYKQLYGTLPPDSLGGYMSGPAALSQDVLDELINWLPPEARATFADPARRKELAEWIVRWRIFADEARSSGFAAQPAVTWACDWAWKVQVVRAYLHSRAMPALASSTKVDTLMSLYGYWDKTGHPGVLPDSAALARIIDTDRKALVNTAVEKLLWDYRNRAGVKFLAPGYSDNREIGPDSLAAICDSLYKGGIYEQANNSYKKLFDLYPFSRQGIEASVELAKLATEREEYAKAADFYRKYLRYSTDAARRSNVFFMLGFIYGEHLNRTELADACYKWILRYDPTNDLADDAEFMCQHIGEPMSGVEELQAEARRQGRQIIAADEAVLPQ